MKFIKVFTATNWTKLPKTENTEQEWVHENLLQVWGFYIDFIKTSHSFRFMQSIGPEQTGGTAARLDLIGTTETWQLEFWSDWSPPLCESVFSYSFLLSCSVVRVLQPADFNHTQRFTAVFLANCLFTFLNHRLHSLLLLFPKSELNWDRKLLGVSTTSKMKNHKRRINNTKLLVVLSCSDVMDDWKSPIKHFDCFYIRTHSTTSWISADIQETQQEVIHLLLFVKDWSAKHNMNVYWSWKRLQDPGNNTKIYDPLIFKIFPIHHFSLLFRFFCFFCWVKTVWASHFFFFALSVSRHILRNSFTFFNL